MPKFQDYSNEIVKSLSLLTSNQRKVLFGDSERFKDWLICKEIEDAVSNVRIIVNGI
jgi:hypothetical protein